MKKIAMFIAFQGFRDEEYAEPKKVFEAAKIKVDTVSTSFGKARGKIKTLADVDKRISEVDINEYDAFCLVGGPGCLEHLDNDAVYAIFRKAEKAGKLIGSICISPIILARAGLLKGRKATCWIDGAEELKKGGAVYTGQSIEEDGRIITANGPAPAKEFGERIVEALK